MMATSSQQTVLSLSSSSHLNGSAPSELLTTSSSHSFEYKRDKKANFRFLDLVEEFDEDLLNRFYNELMVKNFPLEDGGLSSIVIYLSMSSKPNAQN